MLSRRKFIIGSGLVLAAPAIVRASSLMAIKPITPPWVLPGSSLDLDFVNGRAWVKGYGEMSTFDFSFNRKLTNAELFELTK